MSIFNKVIAEENGKKLRAYVVRPKTNKRGPGIVLMHEVYGVTEGLKEVADYFAEQGFVVTCPNMYWCENDSASFLYEPSKEILDSMDDAERDELAIKLEKDRIAARDLMFNIVGNDDPDKGEVITDKKYLMERQAEVLDTINRVSNFLREHDQCTGMVASAGFCFGARNTYIAMAEGADVDAGVAFYPTPKLHEVFDAEAAASIDKPMMFVYGGQDGYISIDEKRAMRDVASVVIRYIPAEDKPFIQGQMANSNIITLAYTANDHGFNRRKSKYSDPGASEHVLTSAVEFLKSALNEKEPSFSIPETARNQMPQSPKYLPDYKV